MKWTKRGSAWVSGRWEVKSDSQMWIVLLDGNAIEGRHRNAALAKSSVEAWAKAAAQGATGGR